MLATAPARSGPSYSPRNVAPSHRVLLTFSAVQTCPTHPVHRCVHVSSSTGLKRRKLKHACTVKRRASCAAVHAERIDTPVDHHGFKWATNVSRHGNVYFAIDETSQACFARMGDAAAEPTVALFFASSSYSVEFDRIIPVLRAKVPSLQQIIGCTVSERLACVHAQSPCFRVHFAVRYL